MPEFIPKNAYAQTIIQQGEGIRHCHDANADPLTLWKIVHDQCVVNFRSAGIPSPCLSLEVARGEELGSASLRDRVGVAQVLVISTRRVTGIEDPFLRQRTAPNYFRTAWSARKLVFAKLGNDLPRDSISIAVNSRIARSQDQLHLHVDCIAPEVHTALLAHQDEMTTEWQKMAVELNGRRYWARRLYSENLLSVSPFRLLYQGRKGAKLNMDEQTLVIVGSTFGRRLGFVLLSDHADAHGGGQGEDLQDHDCRIANGPTTPSIAQRSMH